MCKSSQYIEAKKENAHKHGYEHLHFLHVDVDKVDQDGLIELGHVNVRYTQA